MVNRARVTFLPGVGWEGKVLFLLKVMVFVIKVHVG